MKKPKLMFAFGVHPGGDSKSEPGERDFFRRGIEKAIRMAQGEGRKLTALAEFKTTLEPKQYFSPDSDQQIAALRCWSNGDLRNWVRYQLEYGYQPQWDWFDWGYAGPIVEINLRTPSSIGFEVERTTDRIIENAKFEMGYDTEGRVIGHEVEREANVIRHAIISSHLRAREVAAMIRELQTPDSLFFIPRGFAHRRMITKFGPEYEIEEIEGSGCVPRFQSEAIMLSYKRRLTQEELETCALFKLICQQYLDSPPLQEKKRELARVKGDWIAYRETMKEAKEFTHRIIGEIYALSFPTE